MLKARLFVYQIGVLFCRILTIRKRGGGYQIRLSYGYDTNGKQAEQSMTWRPDKGMIEKQIQKEHRQAVMFEEACMQGHIVATMKFEDFLSSGQNLK